MRITRASQPHLATPPLASAARCTDAYLEFLLLQGLHILLALALARMLATAPFLAITGALNLCIYGRLLYRLVHRSSELANPLWFYIGMSALRMGAANFYVALVLTTGDGRSLNYGQLITAPNLVDGYFILALGDYLFLAGVALVTRMQPLQTREGTNLPRMYRLGAAIAGTGFALRFIGGYVSLGFLGQITGYISDYGVPAGIYLMLVACYRGHRRVHSADYLIAIGVFLANFAFGFTSYMKTDILLGLFPLFFLVLERRRLRSGSRRPLPRGTLWFFAGVLYLFVFTVSGYSELRRASFWEGASNSVTEVAQLQAPAVWPDLATALWASVPGTSAFRQLHRYPDNGAWNLLARISMVPAATAAHMIVQRSGYRDGNILEAIVLSVTPRVLFPDKPALLWGREVSVHLGMASSAETATSATALTMPGSLYWWGGYLTVVAMTLLGGFLFAWIYRVFAAGDIGNPVSVMALMMLVYSGFHWKESSFLVGIPMYTYMLLIFLPIKTLLDTGSKEGRASRV